MNCQHESERIAKKIWWFTKQESGMTEPFAEKCREILGFLSWVHMAFPNNVSVKNGSDLFKLFLAKEKFKFN